MNQAILRRRCKQCTLLTEEEEMGVDICKHCKEYNKSKMEK